MQVKLDCLPMDATVIEIPQKKANEITCEASIGHLNRLRDYTVFPSPVHVVPMFSALSTATLAVAAAAAAAAAAAEATHGHCTTPSIAHSCW